MSQVPIYRSKKAVLARGGTHELPVVLWVPRPMTINDGDDIGGQSVLMCTLPRARFRGLSIGEEVELPLRRAIALVEFEEGLRLAGLLGPREIIKARSKDFREYRVEMARVPIDCHDDWLLDLLRQWESKWGKSSPPASLPASGKGDPVKAEERSVPLPGETPCATGGVHYQWDPCREDKG